MAEVEIFAVGGLVFYVIMAAWIAVMWFLSESEHGFLAFLSVVAYLAILKFVFGVPVELIALKNWQHLLLGVAGYTVVGLGWSCWRWYLFAKDSLEPYKKLRADWLKSKGQPNLKEVPEQLKEEWGKYIKDDSCWNGRKNACMVPQYHDHVAKVMRWIGYWPISLMSWAFNDMVRIFLRMLANFISDWLQSIANRVFAVVGNDLPKGYKM
jgi:hypothetical protein